jgi:hypothetical protein
MITAPGHYDGLPLASYVADPCPAPSLNAGVAAVLVEQSPAHARYAHPRLNPALVREESDAFDVGNSFHAMVLERTEPFVVVQADNWKTKAAQAERTRIRAEGLIPLLPHQHGHLLAMAHALSHVGLPQPGVPERTLVWQETETVWCRARPDWTSGPDVLDLKTTSASAHPAEWSRTLFSTGAYLQEALIRRGWRRLYGHEPVSVRFLVIETTPPYGVSRIALDPEAQAAADQVLDGAIVTWARCLRDNVWPGYSERIAYVELPPWLKTKWADRAFYA